MPIRLRDGRPSTVPVARPTVAPAFPSDGELLGGVELEGPLEGLSHAELTRGSLVLLELLARLDAMQAPVYSELVAARQAARSNAGWMDPRRFAALAAFSERVELLKRRIRTRITVIDRYRGLRSKLEQTERIRETMERGDREARGFKLAARAMLTGDTYVSICRRAEEMIASGEVDRNMAKGDGAGRVSVSDTPAKARRRSGGTPGLTGPPGPK